MLRQPVQSSCCGCWAIYVCVCFALCSVQLGTGGMDALVRLGGGDMRRTLNILQVRSALVWMIHAELQCP